MASGPLKNALRQIRYVVATATAGTLTDRELLERFVLGPDETAFAGLVQRHGPMVLRVCYGVLHNRQDAEDACQAALLVLARKAPSLRRKSSVGSWLYGVALHVASNLRRSLARRRAHETAAAASKGTSYPGPPESDERAALDQELQHLPARFRAPLVLCYLQGKTRDEAARELGWTIGTLRGRLKRGRGLLHRRLRGRGLGLPAALVASLACREALATILAANTVQAAKALALRQPLAALVSPRVHTLMQGAILAMNAKKIATVLLVMLGLVTMGAGLLYSRAAPPGGESTTPVVQPQARKPADATQAADKLLATLPASGSDRLVRAYLGIGSIHARFMPPEGKKCCVLAVAKFKEGQFVGYAEVNLPVDVFVAGKPYEAELGWATRQGEGGFFLVAQLGVANFQPDLFFKRAYVTVQLTDNRQPAQMLGPFYVLGYTFEGSKVAKAAHNSKYDPLDVRDKIQRGEQVVAFLMRPFDRCEEAGTFSKALPKLTGK